MRDTLCQIDDPETARRRLRCEDANRLLDKLHAWFSERGYEDESKVAIKVLRELVDDAWREGA